MTKGKPMKWLKAGCIIIICIQARQTPIAQHMENANLKKPIAFQGNFNLHSECYQAHVILARKKNISRMVAGNSVVDVPVKNLPLSFLMPKFVYRSAHPFDQFGLSPPLQLGHTTLR